MKYLTIIFLFVSCSLLPDSYKKTIEFNSEPSQLNFPAAKSGTFKCVVSVNGILNCDTEVSFYADEPLIRYVSVKLNKGKINLKTWRTDSKILDVNCDFFAHNCLLEAYRLGNSILSLLLHKNCIIIFFK